MENRADELQQFKSDINLTEYLAGQGFKIDRSASSRNSAVMRQGEEKLVVARAQDGHWVYFNTHDDADNGSIIDYVQNRTRQNLGQVRRELRPWIGEAADADRPRPSIEHYARQVERSGADRQRVAVAYSKAEAVTRHQYLEGRGIEAATLADARFRGLVRQDARGNAVFPHFDRQGLSGYELKNNGFTGFSAGGSKALWVSTNAAHASRLVFVESAIDALSHAQLYPDPEAAYVSLGGNPSPEALELARSAIAKAQERGAAVVIGTDADEAGDKLATKLSGGFNDIERDRPGANDWPPVKDWNERLKVEIEREQARAYDIGM